MTALCLIIIALLVVIDRLTKIIMLLWLKPMGTYMLVPGFLRFCYVENTGAAFSMFSGATWVLTVFTAVLTAFCILLIVSPKAREKVPVFKSRISIACLVLVSAGGIGNLIDRVFRGSVIDFIEPLFVDFAVFNFADMLVSVGAVILAVYFIYDVVKDSKKKQKKVKKDE